MFIVLILGLIAAGVFTGAWGFYVVAGVLGAFWMLLSMLAIAGTAKIIKTANKQFNDFDKGFDSDFFKSNRFPRR